MKTKTRKYILETRKQLIFQLSDKGYTMADISRVFNVHRSVITRIISDNMEEYKQYTINNN